MFGIKPLLTLIFFIWCSIGGSLWQMDHGSTGMSSWWFTGDFLFLHSVAFVSTGLDKFPKALAISITHLVYHNLHKLCAHHTEHLAGGNSCWFVLLVFRTELFKQHFCHEVEVPLLDLTDLGHFLSWDRRVPKPHMFLHSELASPVWLKHFVSFSSGVHEGEGWIVSVALEFRRCFATLSSPYPLQNDQFNQHHWYVFVKSLD